MSLHSAIWSRLVRMERHLPSLPSWEIGGTQNAAATHGRRGWIIWAAMSPVVVINLVNLARSKGQLAAAWPEWRASVLDLTLLFAGAIVVAAVAFGVHAWRRGPHA